MAHTHAIDRAEQLLRYDAAAALRSATRLLQPGGLAVDSIAYQRVLLVKGSAQARLGQTQDGARIMREVRAWAEERDERQLLAVCHRRLSTLFRRIGDRALMLEHAVTAVDLLVDDAPDAVRADHLVGLADALGAGGSYPEAIARYREAWELAERCGDRYLQLAVLNNLAYTEYEAGHADEAVRVAERLRTEAEVDGEPLTSHDCDTIARAYTAVGRYDDAVAVLDPLCSGPAPTTGEDCDGLVMALLTMTEVRRLAGAFADAQTALDRARQLSKRYGLTGPLIEAQRQQAELLAARGDYRAAFETFREFHDADVELHAAEREARAQSLNAIFEATEARRSSDYFRELSVRDPLTGLHNRRHLDARLEVLLRDVAVRGDRLSLGIVDLDHFKQINDTRSHAVGDQVLRRIAGLLQACVDAVPDGLAVRMGGEEFLVLLPGLEREAATLRLDELRDRISREPWQTVTDGIAVTASIGVAAAPHDAVEASVLLAAADANLYRAKRGGRDQVVA